MRCRLILVSALALGTWTAYGQAPGGNGQKAYTPPRTEWGHPDLQGVYTFATETPLQRPLALGNKENYSEEELKKMEQDLKKKYEENISTNEHFSYNALWFVGDQGRPTGRTSLLVDPPNGRLPPLTPNGEKLRAELQAAAAAKGRGNDQVINSWTDHTNYNRCISRSMPRVNQEYNQGLEILQTPHDVVIFYESMHDTRIIPLDPVPHLDSSLRQYNWDSRGHWEGNTLVIDWTNFDPRQKMDAATPFGGFAQGNMHVTERLTRVDANTILDQVTVEDPTIWTRPFTYVLPWTADDSSYKGPDDLLEYACHEGNYRMIEDTITGTQVRLREKAAKK